ncbi:MAG: hypothetical protein WD876_03180 [Candidatus Pacearchaeota archaeon]
MKPDYKLRIFRKNSDFWPYVGIGNYVSRNEFVEGTLKLADKKAKWRLRTLEVYNLAAGTGLVIGLSGLEKLL